MRQQVDQAPDPAAAIQQRIEAVNKAFAEASDLMTDLQRDLAAQQAARKALLEQARDQQDLLELNQEQAEKIQRILERGSRRSERTQRHRERWIFLWGLLLSIPIGVGVNYLSPLIFGT
ncbi:hypothetical protein ACFLIM_39070 [Nonomuraea sp. M3C6]|uniref:Uncharacterized protein n=1 Tax=Nonomuraea marmarensis TaxID=3351344 RepID=A0ABW7APB0_9ACTN